MTASAVAMDGRAGRSIWIEHLGRNLWSRWFATGLWPVERLIRCHSQLVRAATAWYGYDDRVACNYTAPVAAGTPALSAGSRWSGPLRFVAYVGTHGQWAPLNWLAET